MRAKEFALCMFTAIATCACGPSIRTAVDYDRTVNFGNYRTFFLLKGNSSGNPLLDQRAADDVHQALTLRGWAEVPEGEGRAAVVVHAATLTKHSSETFYDGWGGWGWRRAPGSTSTFVEDYRVGTVVVDIFDADTKQAMWHGVARDALSGDAVNDSNMTQAAITKMFAAGLLLLQSASPAPDGIRIFFAEAPAALVRVDGNPVYRPIPGTNLERVVNTKALIVRNPDGTHYLRVRDGWMESYELVGEWYVSGWSPVEEARLTTGAALLSDDVVASSRLDKNPPTVFVTLGPAALVVTDGAPRYQTIAGTSLHRLANTTATVYREPTDDQLYVRVGDDWYRAWKIEGRWQHIAAGLLPLDIKQQIGR